MSIKLCVLTQTASEISDYYKSFFKGIDIYFVTFKNRNSNAIDFLPSSSWSEGRNRLWQEVKGKFDYYLFIDDDLEFYRSQFSSTPYIQYVYQQKFKKKVRNAYIKCESDSFFSKLESAITKYKPEVLSVKNLNNLNNHSLDVFALSRANNVRRMGWFDAQFTLFSDYAAHRLLPYDTIVSGWASAQILIYFLAYHVFQSKSISLINLGVNNAFHSGAYVPDYKSNLDCKSMIDLINKHTAKDYTTLFDKKTNHVNLFYGHQEIKSDYSFKGKSLMNFQNNFEQSLYGLENFMINNTLQF